jgi:uncharacterized protein YndB with AHSA1/START domain
MKFLIKYFIRAFVAGFIISLQILNTYFTNTINVGISPLCCRFYTVFVLKIAYNFVSSKTQNNNMENQKIVVETIINAPISKVWENWTEPKHITQWNNASDDWHTPHAENDLRVGGKFLSRMEAKDGSFGFDFEGVYSEIIPFKKIRYGLEDGREVETIFAENGETTKIITTFDAENENPIEMQKGGWQAILNNFKKYVES